MAGTTKRTFKTTKKVVGGRKNYRPWKEWKAGDYVIGKYNGDHEDNYQNTCRMIEVEDAEFQGKPKATALILGKNLVLNSNGMMDKAFEEGDIEMGAYIKVTYNGTSKIEKGKFKGKDAHLVEVDLVEPEDEPSEDEIEDDGEESDEDSPDL